MRQKTLDEALKEVFPSVVPQGPIERYGPGLWIGSGGADDLLGGEIVTSWELLRRMAEALVAKPKEPR